MTHPARDWLHLDPRTCEHPGCTTVLDGYGYRARFCARHNAPAKRGVVSDETRREIAGSAAWRRLYGPNQRSR